MLFPYRIDTLFKHLPIANWVIMGLTIIVFSLVLGEDLPEEVVDAMVLDGWSVSGLLGHLLLHAGILHLAGNMIFLWVFGNAVCANTSNVWFPALYLGFGLAAGFTHLLFDGDPAVGASGAINGVVGMAVAMYPLNQVRVFWLFLVKVGTFEISLWKLAVLWVVLDLWGALTGGDGVAYFAHLGGLGAGIGVGILSLRRGWVELTEYDHESLAEIIDGKTREERRERLRQADLPAPARMLRAKAAAGPDPLVLAMTAQNLARWRSAAESLVISPADTAIIQGGGERAERKKLELLYNQAFSSLGASFPRSLAAYYRRPAGGSASPHEAVATARFLNLVEEDFEALQRLGLIDPEVATLRDQNQTGPTAG